MIAVVGSDSVIGAHVCTLDDLYGVKFLRIQEKHVPYTSDVIQCKLAKLDSPFSVVYRLVDSEITITKVVVVPYFEIPKPDFSEAYYIEKELFRHVINPAMLLHYMAYYGVMRTDSEVTWCYLTRKNTLVEKILTKCTKEIVRYILSDFSKVQIYEFENISAITGRVLGLR